MVDRIFIQLCNNKMNHLGLNTEKLAKMADINHAALNMVLTERVRASLPVALKLAQILDVSLDSLLALNSKAAGMQ
jgi:plasmid maintenance system antidote protein VapI